jgi:NADH-ubiquinone oxidoreductase chain 5
MKVFSCVTYYLGRILFVLGGLRMYWGLIYYFWSRVLFIEWEIFNFGGSVVIITLIFDWVRLRFIGLVILISSIVLFYRTYYIIGDRGFVKFTLMVYLFVLSIIFLVLSPNIIRILLGWDGLGLVSYCLVIYYQNVKSANAGIITVLSNRVGDVAILLRISWLLNFGSWNFFYLQFIFFDTKTSVIIGLVILAAITKRAQIPFSAWLPAAIAAPTPVSALVHSSTLVTAGVYLLIRFNYLIGINNILFYIGVLTIFISGLGANFETDLKKIIALSTLSQLGLIIITLSLGYYEFSYFHLLSHAMFKSLLFLCAGVFIHSIGGTQDIRLIGGLTVSCPATSFYFICARIVLCGVPFLSGFYSKDIILELYFIGGMNLFIFFVVFLSTIFTLTYSVRLMYFIFFNNLGRKRFLSVEESIGIIVPMSFLILMSMIAGGWIRNEFFPAHFIYLPVIIKIAVVVGVIILFLVYLYFLTLGELNVIKWTTVNRFYFGRMWLLPYISRIFLSPLLKIGWDLIKFADHGWLEHIGGQGAIKFFAELGSYTDLFNYLNLKFYLFLTFIIVGFRLFIYLSSSYN